jgi:hypothetical protein
MTEHIDAELREIIEAVWLLSDEKRFVNWVDRKIDAYLDECKAAGGTFDGSWEWLDKGQAHLVRGKMLMDDAEYRETRLEFVRPYLSSENDCISEVLGRALGVNPERVFAEYDRRRIDGTLPVTPKQ